MPQLSSSSKMPNISQSWYALKFYINMFLVFYWNHFIPIPIIPQHWYITT